MSASRTEGPADAAPPPSDASASDASVVADTDVASAVTAFAAARGGLHGRTYQVPTVTEETVCEKRDGGRGRTCRDVVHGPFTKTLFFVGGDVAQGGWLAGPSPAVTMGNPAGVPQTPRGAKLMFEPIDLPRAVRVVDVVVRDTAVYMMLESVAALDQPAGLTAVMQLNKDKVPWSLCDARSATELRARLPRTSSLPSGWDDPDRWKAAAKSAKAFDAMIGPDGLDVFEMWQSMLVRKVEHVDHGGVEASSRKDLLLDLAKRLTLPYGMSDEDRGLSLVGHFGDSSNDEGAYFVAAGGAALVHSVFLSHDPPAVTPDPPMTVAGGEALVAAWRFQHDGPDPRVLAQADLGGGRVFGTLGDGKDVWIVEREGAFTRVMPVLAPQDAGGDPPDAGAGVYPEVRILDTDGDGVAEIVIWDTRVGVPRAWVYRRTRGINEWPDHDRFGVEVLMLGQPSLDEALRAAAAPIERVKPTNMQACVLAQKASTAAGFRSVAAPGARVVHRTDAFSGSSISRVVLAADVKDKDVDALGCNAETVVGCWGYKRYHGLCELGSDETQATHPVFQLVKIGGALKISVVSVFGDQE